MLGRPSRLYSGLYPNLERFWQGAAGGCGDAFVVDTQASARVVFGRGCVSVNGTYQIRQSDICEAPCRGSTSVLHVHQDRGIENQQSISCWCAKRCMARGTGFMYSTPAQVSGKIDEIDRCV